MYTYLEHLELAAAADASFTRKLGFDAHHLGDRRFYTPKSTKKKFRPWPALPGLVMSDYQINFTISSSLICIFNSSMLAYLLLCAKKCKQTRVSRIRMLMPWLYFLVKLVFERWDTHAVDSSSRIGLARLVLKTKGLPCSCSFNIFNCWGQRN